MSWWESLHINLANLVAGFAGGVVNAFVFKSAGPAAIVGSVVVGALTANYLATPAQAAIALVPGFSGTTEHVAAFLVGLGGMGLVRGIAKSMARYRPVNSTGEAK